MLQHRDQQPTATSCPQQIPLDPEQLRHNLMNMAGFHPPIKNTHITVTLARLT